MIQMLRLINKFQICVLNERVWIALVEAEVNEIDISILGSVVFHHVVQLQKQFYYKVNVVLVSYHIIQIQQKV
jgi:hypothetical protein